MPNDFMGLMRDVIVLAYMIGLRVGVPLLITLFAGKWIQRKLAERDQVEERALNGEPFCWDKRRTAQTSGAQAAASAHPELVPQRPGNLGRRAAQEDGVEGGGLRPAFVTVSKAHFYVGVAEPLQVEACLAGKVLDDFDGIDPGHQFCQHCGLVSGAGSDFQDSVSRFGPELLRHERHDVRLGDSLTMPEGQGIVFIGGAARFFRRQVVRVADAESPHAPVRGAHGPL